MTNYKVEINQKVTDFFESILDNQEDKYSEYYNSYDILDSLSIILKYLKEAPLIYPIFKNEIRYINLDFNTYFLIYIIDGNTVKIFDVINRIELALS